MKLKKKQKKKQVSRSKLQPIIGVLALLGLVGVVSYFLWNPGMPAKQAEVKSVQESADKSSSRQVPEKPAEVAGPSNAVLKSDSKPPEKGGNRVAEPGNQAAQAQSAPEAITAIPWKATEDPLPALEFPKAGSVPFSANKYPITSKLNGLHAVSGATGERGGFQVLNLFSGKVVGEVPRQFGNCVVSDDGKRALAVVQVPPPEGSPKNSPPWTELHVIQLESGQTVSKRSLYSGMVWFDFGKTSDIAFFGFNNEQGVNILFLDLRDSKADWKSLPFAKLSGRKNEYKVSVSPNRSFLAVTLENHVELFSLTDGKSVGVVESTGRIHRCIFSSDGKELLLVSVENQRSSPDPQQSPIQWTTYAMSNGKKLRSIEATANLAAEEGVMITGGDANTIIHGTQGSHKYFDLHSGAYLNSVPGTLIGGFDANRILVFDEEKKLLRLQPFDGNLAESRKNLRLILGERPEVVSVDRSGMKQVQMDASAWSLKPQPAPVFNPPVEMSALAPADPACEFLYPRPDVTAQGVIQMKREPNPRTRFALFWSKLDYSTGKLSRPVALWPSALEQGKELLQFGFSTLRADQSQRGDKLALRDPRQLNRIDVWSEEGKRLLGFLADASKDVSWMAWARGDRLLTLTDNGLTGWDGSTAKPVFHISGSIATVLLAHHRDWVAISGANGIDFLDTTTGKHLGRLNEVPSQGPWVAMGVSADGKNFIAARSSGDEQVFSAFMRNARRLEYAVWDLQSGNKVAGKQTVGYHQVKPANVIHSFTDKHWLIGSDVIDIDTGIVAYQLFVQAGSATSNMNMLDVLVTAKYGDRFWMPVAQSVSQRTGTPETRACVWKQVPITQPVSQEDVIFHPGVSVNVSVELDSPDRSKAAKESIESALRKDGFNIGEGGWTLRVKYEQAKATDKLHLIVAGKPVGEILVPVITIIPELVSKNNEVFPLGRSLGEFNRAQHISSLRGAAGITYFDFGPYEAGSIMLREAWENALLKLPSMSYPPCIAKVNGKLVPLPISTSFR